MIAVIFEVVPAPGKSERYLELAATLRPRLEEIDGFISIERFRSLAQPDKLVSLSFWRDEDAVARWRQLEAHRAVQREAARACLPTTVCVSPRCCATTACRSVRRLRRTAARFTVSAAQRPRTAAVARH